MIRSFTTALLALMLAAPAAVADDSASQSNSFTGLRGSLAFEGTIKGKDETTTPPTSLKAGAGTGGGASAYWGWRLPYGFKTEIELLYRYQPLDNFAVNGTSSKIGGYAETLAPMVNAYWGMPLGDTGINPFVGGGVGYAWNELGVNNIAGVAFPAVHNDTWRFAYNLMAGLSVPVGNGTRLTGMYRWLHESIGGNCTTSVICGAHADTSSIDMGLEIDL